MAAKIIRGRQPEMVVQFSVFTPNRLGQLNRLVGLLGSQNLQVLGLTVVDLTDSSIVRLVVDDPDRAREILIQENVAFTENSLVVVELNATEVARLMSVLLEAELDINYLYPFIPHPHGKTMIALSSEDNEVAEQALGKNSFRTLRQMDIVR
jgi:hypothetical protein